MFSAFHTSAALPAPAVLHSVPSLCSQYRSFWFHNRFLISCHTETCNQQGLSVAGPKEGGSKQRAKCDVFASAVTLYTCPAYCLHVVTSGEKEQLSHDAFWRLRRQRGDAFKDIQSSNQARADAKVTAIWRYFYSIREREVNFYSFYKPRFIIRLKK